MQAVVAEFSALRDEQFHRQTIQTFLGNASYTAAAGVLAFTLTHPGSRLLWLVLPVIGVALGFQWDHHDRTIMRISRYLHTRRDRVRDLTRIDAVLEWECTIRQPPSPTLFRLSIGAQPTITFIVPGVFALVASAEPAFVDRGGPSLEGTMSMRAVWSLSLVLLVLFSFRTYRTMRDYHASPCGHAAAPAPADTRTHG